MTKSRRTIVTLGIGLVLILPFTECGLRLAERGAATDSFADRLLGRVLATEDRPSGADPVPHPHYGFTLQTSTQRTIDGPTPYSIDTNQLGFRAKPPVTIDQLPSNTMRVVVLGDDRLFGVGVDASNTFDAQLESVAAAETIQLDVLNYALPGFNSVQALAVGRDLIPPLAPHHTVIGLSLEDDPLANTLVTLDEGRYLPLAGSREALRDELLRRLDLGGGLALERRWALGPGARRLRYQMAEEPAVILRAVIVLQALNDVVTENGGHLTVLLFPPTESSSGSRWADWAGASRITQTYANALAIAGFETITLPSRDIESNRQIARTVWPHLRSGGGRPTAEPAGTGRGGAD
ncbi:MAG: hypothetical protein OEV00_00540 [Acidobacteriota bacterium]|nr:hypothetical protein [Acidobacteriota bacterium]MDH3783791.1 hypothetical protein [Acidobacteriota bacterium]